MFRILVTALLVWQFVATQAIAADLPAPRRVDERRAAQLGLRKIVGRHLRLYTDLPPSDAVDGLAAVFDAAVPQWAEYFEVDPTQLRDWKMQGFLMDDRAKFAALGLLPRERTDFVNGYCNGFELWLVEQPSDYFRRHLLLHEGTHGFMAVFLGNEERRGDTGAGWYSEGMAELLGTHRWQAGQLRLRVMPQSREEVPMWGRIRLIRDAVGEGKPLALGEVLAMDKRRTFSTDEYAWCWALCAFLDTHPRWHAKLRALREHVGEPRFNTLVRQDLREDWSDLEAEWQAFVATLDYGYDGQRMAMQHLESAAVTEQKRATIAADRGWQSTGWKLSANREYRVSAAGRFEIARERGEDGNEIAWPCEPGGVTIRYHEGQPLGLLLGAWREEGNHQFSAAFPLGLSRVIKPPADAVLYLRVNDSAARLSDNRGSLSASIEPTGD